MNLHDLPLSSQRPTPLGESAPEAGFAPAHEPLWLRLKHAVLTRDRRQQIRLAQCGLANMLMLACVAMMHVLDAIGVADHRFIWPWTLTSLGGMVLAFAVIRSGRVAHWRDPSLTMLQMLYAVLCSAAGYSIIGPMRAVIIPILAVVLMFGMFGMTQRQVRVVGVYTLAVFGVTSLYWLHRTAGAEPAAAELARFMMVAIIVAGVVVLTGRLHGMRERSREQRVALSTALERIRELATRDELTGCFNRRAMLERMSEESLRCVRSGAAMCLVLMDLDHFKRINDLHGHAAGDAVLRGFADLARAELRAVDVVARWGGEEFLLMLAATDAAQARLGVLRVLARLEQTRFEMLPAGTAVTCSAGLTLCRGGESIVAAIERADRALYRAKHEGRNRLVCA
ncbi:MAG TPA: GGDEF domain-containing protein [Albitalea sp.]|nr:GGDEF domain-containing protein [Albitalea sp.]